MKNITLPKELFNLPQPWGMTHPQERRQELHSLSYQKRPIKTALNVLERCLHTLSQLSFSKTNCIPEDMITYWGFTAEWLALSIPTFDEFDLNKVKQFLINEQRIDSPSPELIFDVAEYWVWWITWDIERAVLNWVEDALMKTREPILCSRFLLIASRYWQKIEPRMAISLLGASGMIGWQKALPLLESVEQNPQAPDVLKETAQDYRRYVLKHPEKWLPDETLDSIAVPRRAPQRVLQPALGRIG